MRNTTEKQGKKKNCWITHERSPMEAKSEPLSPALRAPPKTPAPTCNTFKASQYSQRVRSPLSTTTHRLLIVRLTQSGASAASASASASANVGSPNLKEQTRHHMHVNPHQRASASEGGISGTGGGARGQWVTRMGAMTQAVTARQTNCKTNSPACPQI